MAEDSLRILVATDNHLVRFFFFKEEWHFNEVAYFQ